MKTHAELSTDSSRIVSQILAQRDRIASNFASIRHRVAIGSGKGGVGKSTLTMQIAAALRSQGYRVALLDADCNGPSLARLAGIQNSMPLPGERGMLVPKNAAGIGVVSYGNFVPEGESLEFSSIAQGDSHVWRATKEFSTLADILAHTDWGELDFLFIDLPPGAERTFQFAEFLGAETSFVLVTIPSALAGEVVSRSVAALRKMPNRVLGYVQNMAGYLCPKCNDVQPLFPQSEPDDIGVPLLGRVPFDPEIARLCDQGKSIIDEPLLASGLAVHEVASQIAKLVEEDR